MLSLPRGLKSGVALRHLCLWWDFSVRCRPATSMFTVGFCHISIFAGRCGRKCTRGRGGVLFVIKYLNVAHSDT